MLKAVSYWNGGHSSYNHLAKSALVFRVEIKASNSVLVNSIRFANSGILEHNWMGAGSDYVWRGTGSGVEQEWLSVCGSILRNMSEAPYPA